MTLANLAPDHARVFDLWHKAINAQDLDALMALYAEDAVIDSTAVLVLEKEPSGILKGKDKLRAHFAAFFALMGPPKGEWIRLPLAASNATNLIWEYPSAGPDGDQLDVVESFDIDGGLITKHRVYWGRVGFKILTDAAAR